MEPVKSARIAAALVYKREIVSVGLCQLKSHPFQKEYGKNELAIFLHAETCAIKNAVNDRVDPDIISKSTLYVARQKFTKSYGDWTQGIAKPCFGCQRCIATYDIKQVVYTLDNAGYAVVG